MSNLFMPLKFECSACHQNYYQHYKNAELHYPQCPFCDKKGLLIGTTEIEDLVKHPINFMRYIFKSLNRPNKQHS